MQFFHELESIVSNQLAVIRTCLSITRLEARLAGLSVAPLLVSVCLLFIGLISVWFSGMALLGYSLMLVTNNIMMALSSVFITNSLILAIVYMRMRRNLKNMSFEKTRAYLSRSKESHDIKKTGHQDLSHSGKDLMDTTSAAE